MSFARAFTLLPCPYRYKALRSCHFIGCPVGRNGRVQTHFNRAARQRALTPVSSIQAEPNPRL